MIVCDGIVTRAAETAARFLTILYKKTKKVPITIDYF